MEQFAEDDSSSMATPNKRQRTKWDSQLLESSRSS